MTARHWLVLVLLVPLYLWRLDRPGFSDTEGMFAEPARGMLASGDWVTPRVNGEPFFTKPPLIYWLAGGLWSVTGPTEYARIWPVAAGLGTVALTASLGTRLFGPAAGFAAAAVLGTSAGQFLEARMLRADMVLMFVVTAALWAWLRLRTGEGHRGAALTFWSVLAVGLLDKGFLVLVLVGGVIACVELLEGHVRPAAVMARLRVLHLPLGLAVLAVIAAPWHVVAAWRNPGFVWDYVVNQHLMFFFDRKLPRDSIPDSLGFFWEAFGLRGLPWSLVWPAALVHAVRTVRARPGSRAAYRLVAVWLGVVLGFFSLASSRLEHYALPAMPAAALLVGGLIGDAMAGEARVGPAWVAGPLVLVGLGALAALALDPHAWITGLEPTLAGYSLERLALPSLLIPGVGLLAAAAFVARGRLRLAMSAGVALSAALLVVVQLAHERVEPLFSWRPLAAHIHAVAPAGARVFFHASDEYQLCGGLSYYLAGQRLDLLMPPGWVAPTFLEGRVEHLFTSEDVFAAAWRTPGSLLVSDDVWPPGTEASLVPGPYAVVARDGSKVLLRARGGGPDITSRLTRP